MLIRYYSGKRTPSWTDRILYASGYDVPRSDEELEEGSSSLTAMARKGSSVIENLVYTSVPSYTTSDHVRFRKDYFGVQLTEEFIETDRFVT